ncbi:TonB protein [gamma proteobacterium HTCC5015]|nr:TonB protein [gamma proteobacterium HTCC5015]
MYQTTQAKSSWLIAGTLVTLTHIAVGAALLHESSQKTPQVAPPQAAVIEINMAPPAQPEPKPEPKPEPLPTAPPEHDAVLPEPEPQPEPEPEEKEPEPQPVEEPPPPSEPVQSETIEGVSQPQHQVDAIVDWQGRLLIHLENHKRYPRLARRRHYEGTAIVSFTIDRQGRVSNAALKTSSGHRSLDRETLELLERAQPLPKPPESVEGNAINMSVPVEFELR